MQYYKVTFYLKRTVLLTVACSDSDDPAEVAAERLELQEGEEIDDSDYLPLDPDDN